MPLSSFVPFYIDVYLLRLEVSALVPKCPSPSADPILCAWNFSILPSQGNFLLPLYCPLHHWLLLHRFHWMLGKLFHHHLPPGKGFGGVCSWYEYHEFSLVLRVLHSFSS